MANQEERRSWKLRNRPYLYAIAIAMVMTMIIAPEVYEGDSMSPTLEDGQVVVMTRSSYSDKRGTPENGQVVVLKKIDTDIYGEDNLISTVVAQPGDSIEMRDGVLKINGNVVNSYDMAEAEDFECELQAGEVFLLNKNPKNFNDSRTFGPVDSSNIRGDAKFIVWPLSDIGGIENERMD